MPHRDVKVKIVYAKGKCIYGNKLGDEWIVGPTTPAGICSGAWNVIWPFVRVLQRGGHYEYPPGSGVARFGCPDPWNLRVFELSVMPGPAKEDFVGFTEGSGDLKTLN